MRPLVVRMRNIGTALLNLSEKEAGRKTIREIDERYKDYRILMGLDKPSSPDLLIPEDVI